MWLLRDAWKNSEKLQGNSWKTPERLLKESWKTPENLWKSPKDSKEYGLTLDSYSSFWEKVTQQTTQHNNTKTNS